MSFAMAQWQYDNATPPEGDECEYCGPADEYSGPCDGNCTCRLCVDYRDPDPAFEDDCFTESYLDSFRD